METMLIQITNYLLARSWQIAVLVIVIAALSLLMKNKSAHIRYLLWLIVLAKCLLPPLFTIPLPILLQEKQLEPVPASKARIPVLEYEVVNEVESEYVVSPSASMAVPPEPPIIERDVKITIHEVLGFGWISGAAVILVFALIKALRTNRWLHRQRRRVSSALQTDIDNLSIAFGIRAMPKFWLVEGIGQPFVWGFPRGDIYLPSNFAGVDNTEYRQSVLMHELSHILRFDATVNLLQVISQAIFWFHPFVWLANRNLRQERERCCDETAIARLNASPKDYSSAIVETLIAERESSRPVPSLAIARPVRNIEDRIKSIMWPGRKFYKRPGIIAVVSVFVLAILTVPTTLALTTRQVDTPSGPGKDSADAPDKPGPGDNSIFAKDKKIILYGTDKQDSTQSEASIVLNDLQRQTDELRDILQGELYSIHTGRRDDKGAEVIIVYFKGEKAENKPLVFHLAEEDRIWLVDYFYVGSLDTEREELLGSRKKFSGTQHIMWVNDEMIVGLSNIRLATADKNPIGTVGKQIRQLRNILKGQFIERVIILPGDGAIVAITELTKVADREPGHLFFHLQNEDEGYSIECIEARLVDEAKETRFDPWKELPESKESKRPGSETKPEDTKDRLEEAFKAAFEKIRQLYSSIRNKDWKLVKSHSEDLKKNELAKLKQMQDSINAQVSNKQDGKIIARIIYDLYSLCEELNNNIPEGFEYEMLLQELDLLSQELDQFYGLLKQSKYPGVALMASRTGGTRTTRIPERVASDLPDGTSGYALEFDGKDDFVMIPPSRSLDIHGSLTISAWVKHGVDAHGVITWRGDGGVARDPYALELTRDRMVFRMDVGDGRQRGRRFVRSRERVDDQWHFWTAICDKEAGKMYLYKDGNIKGHADIDVKFEYDTSEMWNMIGAVVLYHHSSEHFKGTIDEVRIWNVARSWDQVMEYMNRSLTGSEPGLVGYWKFDQEQGDTINNSTAYLNNGVAGKLLWDI